jgi:hypothetical protein
VGWGRWAEGADGAQTVNLEKGNIFQSAGHRAPDADRKKQQHKLVAQQTVETVARQVRLSEQTDLMWRYLQQLVEDDGRGWGQGRWVTLWAAAVAYIVARVEGVHGLTLSEVAAAVSTNGAGIHHWRLWVEYRWLHNLLRLRCELEARGVSPRGMAFLLGGGLEPPSVAQLLALERPELEALGGADRQGRQHRLQPADVAAILGYDPAAGPHRPPTFPVPEVSADPRDFVDVFVKVRPGRPLSPLSPQPTAARTAAHSAAHLAAHSAACTAAPPRTAAGRPRPPAVPPAPLAQRLLGAPGTKGHDAAYGANPRRGSAEVQGLAEARPRGLAARPFAV